MVSPHVDLCAWIVGRLFTVPISSTPLALLALIALGLSKACKDSEDQANWLER